MAPKIPDPVAPKIPINAITPASDLLKRPLGRKSLVNSTADTRTKPAFTMKSSLLGGAGK